MSHKLKGRNNQKRREQELQKRQRQKKVAILLIAIVAAACVGGISWSVYNTKQQEEAQLREQQEQLQKSKENTNSEVVNVDPLLEYLSGLDTELLNEEIGPDAATDDAAQSE